MKIGSLENFWPYGNHKLYSIPYLGIQVNNLINTDSSVQHIKQLGSVDSTSREDPLKLQDEGHLRGGFPLSNGLDGLGVRSVRVVGRVEENGSLCACVCKRERERETERERERGA